MKRNLNAVVRVLAVPLGIVIVAAGVHDWLFMFGLFEMFFIFLFTAVGAFLLLSTFSPQRCARGLRAMGFAENIRPAKLSTRDKVVMATLVCLSLLLTLIGAALAEPAEIVGSRSPDLRDAGTAALIALLIFGFVKVRQSYQNGEIIVVQESDE